MNRKNGRSEQVDKFWSLLKVFRDRASSKLVAKAMGVFPPRNMRVSADDRILNERRQTWETQPHIHLWNGTFRSIAVSMDHLYNVHRGTHLLSILHLLTKSVNSVSVSVQPLQQHWSVVISWRFVCWKPRDACWSPSIAKILSVPIRLPTLKAGELPTNRRQGNLRRTCEENSSAMRDICLFSTQSNG